MVDARPRPSPRQSEQLDNLALRQNLLVINDILDFRRGRNPRWLRSRST
jgi:hypothetical protein